MAPEFPELSAFPPPDEQEMASNARAVKAERWGFIGTAFDDSLGSSGFDRDAAAGLAKMRLYAIAVVQARVPLVARRFSAALRRKVIWIVTETEFTQLGVTLVLASLV